MRKILILTYEFPPYVSVAGLRPYSWYIYLKEFGVYPIIATRQWDNKYGNELDYVAPSNTQKTIIEETEQGTIIKTPYKPNLANRILLKYGKSKFNIIRRTITAYYEIFQFILPIGTKYGLYKGAKQYLAKNKVDAIITTTDPFILFKYASKLSKKHKIPWIADYRDPWNTNDSKGYFKKFYTFFEKKYVPTASYFVTVSEYCEHKIKKTIGNDKTFNILPNGYNPNIIDKIKNIKQNNNILSFAFIGSIHNWQPYINVLNCFNNFIKDNPNKKIKLDFFGVNISEKIKQLLNEKYTHLKPHVNIYFKIPNEKLLTKLKTYNVMLLLNYYSYTGTKIYDYLATKRLILLCYSNDPDAMRLKKEHYPHKDTEGLSTNLQEDIIQKTKSGIIAKDSKHLNEILKTLHQEFSKTKEIKCNSINTEQFSRKHQVKKLADIIKQLITY